MNDDIAAVHAANRSSLTAEVARLQVENFHISEAMRLKQKKCDELSKELSEAREALAEVQRRCDYFVRVNKMLEDSITARSEESHIKSKSLREELRLEHIRGEIHGIKRVREYPAEDVNKRLAWLEQQKDELKEYGNGDYCELCGEYGCPA